MANVTAPLESRLVKPSKEYSDLKPYWEFLIASYSSGYRYVSKRTLFKHARETDTDYANRLRRATPPGYARAVINTYASLLRRGGASRSTGNPEFEEFLKTDCDMRGTPFDQFVLDVCFPVSQAIGFTWCLVDMLPVPDEVLSAADEQEAGLVPYTVHYSPLDVVNWGWDMFGRLAHATVKAKLPDGKDGYKLWLPDSWALYSAEYALLDRQDHSAGVVPFALLYNERDPSDQNAGVSAITNIAYLNREVFNLQSLIQEFMYKQCFNILILDEDMLSDKGRLAIGTSNALPASKEGVLPQYVSPPSEPAQYLRETIDSDIQAIYAEAGLVDRSAHQQAQAQSGISRAFEFHNTNTLLRKKASNLEDFERAVADLWFAWMDGDSDYVVSYPADFDIRDLTQELDEFDRIAKAPLRSPTLVKYRAKRLARMLTTEADEETAQAVEDEVEEATFAGGAPTQAQNPNTSAASPLAARFAQLAGAA